MTDTPYFFRRNRDLGTISVYVGYRDVRFLPPLSVHILTCVALGFGDFEIWKMASA